jgi:hypothetical protein
MSGPSPERIAWIERVTGQWADRATALRIDGHPSAATRAAVLYGIVHQLRSELPAPALVSPPMQTAVPIPATAAEADRLEAIVARCTGPYFHEGWGVMVNDAPFLDDVEHDLRCRIARLRGLPAPPFVRLRAAPAGEAQPVSIAPPPIPPPEAVPFRAGPQLTLFEYQA